MGPGKREVNVGDQVAVIYNGFAMSGVVVGYRVFTSKRTGRKGWIYSVRITNKAGKSKVREYSLGAGSVGVDPATVVSPRVYSQQSKARALAAYQQRMAEAAAQDGGA